MSRIEKIKTLMQHTESMSEAKKMEVNDYLNDQDDKILDLLLKITDKLNGK